MSHHDNELVERVARGLFQESDTEWPNWKSVPPEAKEQFTSQAESAISDVMGYWSKKVTDRDPEEMIDQFIMAVMEALLIKMLSEGLGIRGEEADELERVADQKRDQLHAFFALKNEATS